MLGRLLKFPYANAKARAMIAGCMGKADMEMVLKAPSHQAAVALLRQRGMALDAAHDRRAEVQLRGDYIAYGAKVARALRGEERSLLEAFLLRADVENLKTLCRALTGGEDLQRVYPLLVPAELVGGLSVDMLRRVRSFEDLLALMGRNPLQNVVRQSLESPPEKRLHRLEIALDGAWWGEVGQRLLPLAPFDRSVAEELLACRADIDRWHVIHRGLDARLAEDEVLNALPPLGTVFAPQEVRQALRSDDPVAVFRKRFPVKSVADPFAPAGEVALFKRLHRTLRRAVLAPPFDIAMALSAVLLKELEVRDLQAILSGLRLGGRPQPILAHAGG